MRKGLFSEKVEIQTKENSFLTLPFRKSNETIICKAVLIYKLNK